MSNIINDSNDKSVLLNSLSAYKKDWTYDFKMLPSGFKHDETFVPSYDVTDIYDTEYLFDIEKKGILTKLVFKFTLTSTGNNLNTEDRLGAHIFRSIAIRSVRSKKVIQTITPEYTDFRIDTLSYTNMKTMNVVTDTDVPFNNNTVVCYCPCFFWFSDNPAAYINIDTTEPLEVVAITAVDKGEMGLPEDLTAIDVELIGTFIQRPISDLILGPSVYRVVGYDILQELDQTVNGTSSEVAFSRVSNVFRSVSCLVKNRAYRAIDSFVLKSANFTIASGDSRLNLISNGWNSKEENFNAGNQIWFYNWGAENDYNNISQSAYLANLPTVYLESTFTNVSDYTQRTFHLYWSVITIDSDGIVSKSFF